ncbi:MAG: acetoacetate--CoA ligase [Candidatus Marinimicrobia bacterium]|jgi:acetoacetyl-CoA synthetase|nr:acetoacetate--CoA ligase [Candidatus Neomarinimicrobiota bacterium]
MGKIIWKPKKNQVLSSQMWSFLQGINKKNSTQLKDYQELYSWSVDNPSMFWEFIWEFCDVIHSQPYSQIVDNISCKPGAKWFPSARLNFAENLLRFKDDHPAIIFIGEDKIETTISYGDLFQEVIKTAAALKFAGVNKGDRVAGFIPNIPEAVIAMLASATIGAVWSSSSPDFGIKGVLDRFSQIKPKVLFTADGYFYNGKRFDTLKKLKGIVNQLPSVKKVIIIPYTTECPHISSIPNSVLYDDFISGKTSDAIEYNQLPFDHPLYIMYSSGTTGLPKSIVHSAGGTLIQHVKELRLHTNLTRKDTIFYFTTTGWMMWNWLVSSLAVGATVVLYDGSPLYPNSDAMWKMAEELGITVFGTSAKFIAASEVAGVKPHNYLDLSKLKTILSTGSPLVEENYDYIYRDVKPDVQLSSISGGTDIISCFALGNPILPVYRGELQCRGLGMAVDSFNENGDSLCNQKGELVCKKAFPSMPVYFWNDPDGQKYHEAYFDDFDGIWSHGDYITINDHGGVKIFGRSDATLNPGGVRIGTAEIYRVVENFQEVEDSLVVGQEWKGDERIILFIKISENKQISDELIVSIKDAIRKNCSPRHVPEKILPTPDIPYTINGKKVELSVKNIIAGKGVSNRDALANPDSLEHYKNLIELQS